MFIAGSLVDAWAKEQKGSSECNIIVLLTYLLLHISQCSCSSVFREGTLDTLLAWSVVYRDYFRTVIYRATYVYRIYSRISWQFLAEFDTKALGVVLYRSCHVARINSTSSITAISVTCTDANWLCTQHEPLSRSLGLHECMREAAHHWHSLCHVGSTTHRLLLPLYSS